MDSQPRFADRMLDHLSYLNNLLLIPMFTVMVLETSVGTGAPLVVGFNEINLAFCALFMTEWAWGLGISDDRKGYLLSWEKGADFIASIPFGYLFQTLRVTRLVRIFRLVRLILRARKFRGKGRKIVRVIGVVASTVFAGGLALRIAEPQTVEGLGDALWWSLITVSTVGYGDVVPVTPLGRIVGSILVLSGIGVFGFVAGFMTSLMEDPEEDEILLTVQRIESQLERLVSH